MRIESMLFYGGVVGMLLLGGCAGSHPPLQEIKSARMALLNAEEAKESADAAHDYERARKELERAEALLKAKRYDEAKAEAQKARADARLAKVKRLDAVLRAQVSKLEAQLREIRKEFATIDEEKGE